MNAWFTGPLTVERLQVAIADLPLRLRGLRIIQLSDFHYDGVQLSSEMLEEAIAIANQQSPDLVCLTGDYVTTEPEPAYRLATQLKAIRSTYGTYAVLGNHDLLRSRSKAVITQALTQAGIRVLWNERVYPAGPGLVLVGLPDFRSRRFHPEKVLDDLDPQMPRLVLSHNPDSAAVLKRWRVDLQLSGHTHGGQICIPGIGPLPKVIIKSMQQLPHKVQRRVKLVRSFSRILDHWEWSEGFHRVGQNQLYVNRGLGTYPPGRLFCPPEITVITLI